VRRKKGIFDQEENRLEKKGIGYGENWSPSRHVLAGEIGISVGGVILRARRKKAFREPSEGYFATKERVLG